MGRTRILICLSVVLLASQMRAEQPLSHELNNDFQNKIVLLRNFYRGDQLRYDSAGDPLGNPSTGYWTVDGAIAISKVSISHDRLQIRAKRLFVSSSPDGYGLSRSQRDLTIEVEFTNQAITLDSVRAVTNHIFLTSQDRVADFVPAFWKRCFGEQTTAGPEVVSSCHMSPRFAPLFKFSTPQQAASTAVDPTKLPEDKSIFKVGNGITAPRAVYAPDPEYSEEARKERIDGMVIISLVVDKFGKPIDVKLVSPIGYGLDEKAIDTVKKWKFEPGRRGGEPVAVYATIEVAFHIH